MTFTDQNEIFEFIKAEIGETNFDFTYSLALTGGFNIVLSQRNSSKLNSIVIGLTKYNHFNFDTISANIAFFELNKVLSSLFTEVSMESINIKNGHVGLNNLEKFTDTNSLLPIEINDQESLTEICSLIKEFIKNEAIPFFNKWNSLKDLIPLLETSDIRELGKIFGGNGLIEKITILHLCDHPESFDFYTQTLDKYEQKARKFPDEDAYQYWSNILTRIGGLLEIEK